MRACAVAVDLISRMTWEEPDRNDRQRAAAAWGLGEHAKYRLQLGSAVAELMPRHAGARWDWFSLRED